MPMNGDAEYSLYIHIPFCTKKCDYCHFFVLPDKELYKQQLLSGLRKEWELIQPKTQNKRLVSIYFGGGTPSLFGPERIEDLLNLWEVGDCEVTLEANPELITQDLMKDYAEAGINRLSMGVQSFDDGLLSKLSRTHSAQTAIKAIEAASRHIPNISIDLMYDIPGQTLSQWSQTLDLAMQCPITHISLYNLTFEPRTVFYKYRKSLQKSVPGEQLSLEMFENAVAVFTKHQFHQYEISAFSKTGFESKHNLGYWLGRPFLGLGPSAYSFWEGSRTSNIAHLAKYLSALENQQKPIGFSETLEPDAAQRELFVIRLRVLKGVDMKDFSSIDKEAIEQLADQGLLSIQDQHVKLTRLGVLHYDTIAAELI